MELSDELLTDISYIKISTYRSKVIKSLENDYRIPTGISKATGIRTNHVSNVLTDLREREFVECINPEAKKGRLYRLTKKGMDVAKNLDFK